jgi:hypothetical protein
MRAVIDIPDSLYRKLKATAARQRCSVNALILRGIKTQLSLSIQLGTRIRLPIVRSKRPGSLRLILRQIFQATQPPG